jgi:hypothetical protein
MNELFPSNLRVLILHATRLRVLRYKAAPVHDLTRHEDDVWRVEPVPHSLLYH